jgi:hypothetical protein
MTPNALINRLERLEFTCSECWDGTYQIKINRQISGLPERVARALSDKLTEVCKHIAEECRNEMVKKTVSQLEPSVQSFLRELGTAHNDVGNGDNVRAGSVGDNPSDPRD